jgi:hypothetical protein
LPFNTFSCLTMVQNVVGMISSLSGIIEGLC